MQSYVCMCVWRSLSGTVRELSAENRGAGWSQGCSVFEVSQGLTASLPMETPFPHPFSPSLRQSRSISFFFFHRISWHSISSVFLLSPIDSGSMQKHTGALLGLLALPKQGFVQLEKQLLIRVSVNTNMMSCHLLLFNILADIQSCALRGKRAQKADPQPWDGWVYGY